MASATQLIINVDGNNLPGAISLSIFQNLYSHNSFELVCRADALGKFKDTGDNFVIRKADGFIGKKITIQVKKENKKLYNLFKGLILEIEGTQYQDAFSGSIIFRGKSYDFLMDGEHQARFFEKMSLNSIFSKLKGESAAANLFNGVKFSPRFSSSIALVTQYNETDYQLLNRLAQKYGEWLLVDNENNFYFGEPPANTVTLKSGADLHEFSFSMRLEPLQLKYTAYDYLQQKLLTSSYDPGQVHTESYLSKSVGASNNHFSNKESFYYNDSFETGNLDAAARTDGSSRIAQLNTARGSSDNPEVSIGCKVKINTGVDSGEYRVVSLHHNCDEGGNYSNHFIGIPSYLAIPPQANPNIIPRCEAQNAIVTSVDDPDGMGRIKVKFYWNDGNIESPWLRVLTPYSGNQMGFYFLPEIGQEVLVGFENNHPERPYVIGAHYNGKNKPDNWKNNKNYKKALRTQSGHTIEFNDEKGKEEITIYDKDQVNTITLSSHGKLLTVTCKGDLKVQAENISITANKDYTLDVKGQIKVSSGKDTTVEASGNCKVKANQNVEIEAASSLKAKANSSTEISGATLTAKGSATAEISAGGQTTVKGAIVMIN